MLQIPLYHTYYNQLKLLVTQNFIDNIFSNIISHDVISGNISGTISDHLPEFLFTPNVLPNNSCQKSNIYEWDWSRFIQIDFLRDYFDKDWSDVLQLDEQDINLPLESFLNNMNSILDEHAPLKRINKYKLKFKSEPLITPFIQKGFIKKVHKCKRSTNKKLFTGNIKITEICYLHYSKKQNKLLQSVF